jgi:PAS domain S-box-containing protein
VGHEPPDSGAVVPDSAAPEAAADVLSTEQVFGQVEAAMLVVDHFGVLRYANHYAATLFGFPSPEHMTGGVFVKLGFDDDDSLKLDSLKRQACKGKDWEGTVSIRRPDGAKFFIRLTASPLRDEAGEITGSLIMARQAVQLGGGGALRQVGQVGLLDWIGERLSTTLPLAATLDRVAETLVPQFADHCLIDLWQEKDLSRRVLVRRVLKNAWNWEPPPGSWAQPGDLPNYPKGHFCLQAMDENETLLVDEPFERKPDYPAPSEESMQASREVGITSVITAPLQARGRMLGVMTLVLSGLTVRDVRDYAPDDRDTVAGIASRIAIAIDNAMLFEEERETALAFQDSLLPRRLPVLDGIDVAHKYVPAQPLEKHGQGIQTQVGGDWYDIIPLSAGRVGIVIGDVQGRGAKAAAIMGQLRSAVRAFALDDKAPAEILQRLDEWVCAMADDETATDAPIVSCTYMVYDPWFGELTLANAGHWSPMLVSGGDVKQLKIEEGLLLGVRGVVPGLPPHHEETRDLPPGSTLVFFTDGLIDRRPREDGSGDYTNAEVFRMLGAAVKSVAEESVWRIANAAQNAVPGHIDDDMAILVVRTASENLKHWDVQFPAEAIKVSEARRMAFDMFIECGMDDEQADLACLLVSEVVTNVVRHTTPVSAPRHEYALETAGPADTGGQRALDVDEDWAGPTSPDELGKLPSQDFKLRIRKGQDAVWVEVFDSDLRLPRIRMAGETDEGGRGLYLVEQLATRWGSRPTDDGKAVWFEMPIKAGVAP